MKFRRFIDMNWIMMIRIAFVLRHDDISYNIFNIFLQQRYLFTQLLFIHSFIPQSFTHSNELDMNGKMFTAEKKKEK